MCRVEDLYLFMTSKPVDIAFRNEQNYEEFINYFHSIGMIFSGDIRSWKGHCFKWHHITFYFTPSEELSKPKRLMHGDFTRTGREFYYYEDLFECYVVDLI